MGTAAQARGSGSNEHRPEREVPSPLIDKIADQLGTERVAAVECANNFREDIFKMLDAKALFSDIANTVVGWHRIRMKNSHPRRRPAAHEIYGANHRPIGGNVE